MTLLSRWQSGFLSFAKLNLAVYVTLAGTVQCILCISRSQRMNAQYSTIVHLVEPMINDMNALSCTAAVF
jgi:hypothetical protein